MLTDILLFIIYLFAACYLLGRSSFIRKSGLSFKLIAGLFLLKIGAGMLNAWIHLHVGDGITDYWHLHSEGVREKAILLSDPATFFKELLMPRYGGYSSGLFETKASFWNDFNNNIIVKLLAILNNITNGNYYTNSIFFNFFGFFGHVALYKLLTSHYGQKNIFILASCFLIPTSLAFTSCIHKDLFVFTSLSFFSYALYSYMKGNNSRKVLWTGILSLLILFVFRNYLAMAVLPAAAAYLWSVKRNRSPVKAFVIVYGTLIFITALSALFIPEKGPLGIISNRQADFSSLGPASTNMEPVELRPSLSSFITNLPLAVNHALFRPYIWEPENIFHRLAAAELLFFLMIMITGLFFSKSFRLSPFELFLIFFCLTGLILAGYIVGNYGSLIRYRSIYFPFLLPPFLAAMQRRIDIKRIKI